MPSPNKVVHTIRTEGDHYLLPDEQEMKAMARQAEVKHYPTDLVEDFCNLQSGGYCVSEETLSQNLKRRLGSNEGENYRHHYRYEQNIQQFLTALDRDNIPGHSPLEQAMNLLKILGGRESTRPDPGSGAIPELNYNNPAQLAQEVNQAIKQASALSPSDKAHLGGAGGDKGTGTSDELVELAKDLFTGKAELLRIARMLERSTVMKTMRERAPVYDPEGTEVHRRPIAHLGELHRLPQAEWVLPANYRMYRAITHQAQIRERVHYTDKKQLLYMIIDCSGSMGQERIYKAGGVLCNRLDGVRDGDAELYVRHFDTRLYEEFHAAKPEDIAPILQHFTRRHSAGGTEIGGCAIQAVDRIHELMANGLMYKPELVIVTDGGDDVSALTIDKLRGIRLHAFIVDAANDDLVSIARRTGGVAVQNL